MLIDLTTRQISKFCPVIKANTPYYMCYLILIHKARAGNLTISFVSIDPVLLDNLVNLGHLKAVITHYCPTI